jgi:putative nucleotidyltransferase with HDIG domain
MTITIEKRGPMHIELQQQTIPSGSYWVGATGPTLLQSFLGTCVGVAAYDPQGGIGGMIHLLLPEPVGSGTDQVDARYARTGIPLFLHELYQAGATRDNLTAVIAGGALVGPLSTTDLDLNIGGRTAEVVNTLLSEEGISIAHWETGGFFTCSLSLDMSTFSYRIEPVGKEEARADETVKPSSREDILLAMENIQPIPQVALKILHMIDNGSCDTKAIAEEIKKDQVISARTIQLCNSALFAKKSRIESLDHALVYLGENMFVRMIISAAVENFFGASVQGYSLCMGGLFHHAVGTAVIAEKIAHYTGAAELSTAYTAGLLHDIGKVVLDQNIASAYPLFYRRINREDELSTRVEKDLFGIDHTVIGRKLADMWAFPESLKHSVAYHHEPEKAPRHTKLVHIVYLADLLMARFNTGLELEGMGGGSIEDRLHRVDLNAGDLTAIIDLIPQALFSADVQKALPE